MKKENTSKLQNLNFGTPKIHFKLHWELQTGAEMQYEYVKLSD